METSIGMFLEVSTTVNIIVKDESAKEFFTTNFPSYTNIEILNV